MIKELIGCDDNQAYTYMAESCGEVYDNSCTSVRLIRHRFTKEELEMIGIVTDPIIIGSKNGELSFSVWDLETNFGAYYRIILGKALKMKDRLTEALNSTVIGSDGSYKIWELLKSDYDVSVLSEAKLEIEDRLRIVKMIINICRKEIGK